MSREPLPSVASPELEAFAGLAREFCQTIEQRAALEREDFLSAVHVLLAHLYVGGLSLPSTGILFSDDDAEAEDSDADDTTRQRDRRTHEEWRQLYDSLQEVIGRQDLYREVFDPYEPENEKEVSGSIADDLADTYYDLRTGLAAWERGESGEALWEWRFNFEAHWGKHVTGALRALHALCAWYDGKWPTGDPGTVDRRA